MAKGKPVGRKTTDEESAALLVAKGKPVGRKTWKKAFPCGPCEGTGWTLPRRVRECESCHGHATTHPWPGNMLSPIWGSPT